MKRPPEIYNRAEILALLRAARGRGPLNRRNQALVIVLWRSGLRIAEALALRPRDLDPDRGTARVQRGKGGGARTVALDPDAWALLEPWLRIRATLPHPRSGPVFCSRSGGALDPSYVRRLLPRLGRRAGISRRIHAHGLRHTHAVELATEGVPLPIVQAQLGHRNLGTTSRYLAHFGSPELVAAIGARSIGIGERRPGRRNRAR